MQSEDKLRRDLAIGQDARSQQLEKELKEIWRLEEELNRLSCLVTDLTDRVTKKVDLETLNKLLSKMTSKVPVTMLAPPTNFIGEEEFNRFKEKIMEFIRGLEKRFERCRFEGFEQEVRREG
jgi:hypothetical protein